MLTQAQKKVVATEKKRRKEEREKYLRALGERLRERASNQHITAAMIAEECHISRQGVADWFKTGRIHKHHLSKLARLLNWTVFEMLGDVPASLADTVISSLAQYLAELFDELPHEEQQNVWPALLKLLERPADGDGHHRSQSSRSAPLGKRRH